MPGDQCNYCHAPIRWLKTGAGKNMPVDAVPDPARGNVLIVGGLAAVLGPGPARGARATGKQLYLHHAATCPHAEQWRSTGTPAQSAQGRRPAPQQRRRSR